MQRKREPCHAISAAVAKSMDGLRTPLSLAAVISEKPKSLISSQEWRAAQLIQQLLFKDMRSQREGKEGTLPMQLAQASSHEYFFKALVQMLSQHGIWR